jgi:hypothetical protein
MHRLYLLLSTRRLDAILTEMDSGGACGAWEAVASGGHGGVGRHWTQGVRSGYRP